MGWRYYKLDALRHLRYEGYNSHADYFRDRGLDREEVFRRFARTVRDAIGPDAFLLACWGIRPELVGLVDAVRVGNDGFGYGGLAQYNSFNNVVWRNDPDHIQLTAPDAYRAATLASLTGSLLMLTDRPEVYRTPRAEIAKRTAPVLFTRPEQIYDVDPVAFRADRPSGHRGVRLRAPVLRRRQAPDRAPVPPRREPTVRALVGARAHGRERCGHPAVRGPRPRSRARLPRLRVLVAHDAGDLPRRVRSGADRSARAGAGVLHPRARCRGRSSSLPTGM